MRWDDGSPMPIAEQLKIWLILLATTPIVAFLLWIWIMLILLPGD